MAIDKTQVRVLRMIEYVGDRTWVEEQIRNSIHGVKRIENGKHGSGEIRVATLGVVPDVLDTESE